jgi:hypothetical protein
MHTRHELLVTNQVLLLCETLKLEANYETLLRQRLLKRREG